MESQHARISGRLLNHRSQGYEPCGISGLGVSLKFEPFFLLTTLPRYGLFYFRRRVVTTLMLFRLLSFLELVQFSLISVRKSERKFLKFSFKEKIIILQL